MPEAEVLVNRAGDEAEAEAEAEARLHEADCSGQEGTCKVVA